MSKPVTELYERLEHWAATDIDEAEVFHAFQAGAAIQQLAKAAGVDTPRFLDVLDLVATSDRLGLVRWVVGLSDADLNLLGGALTRDTMRLDTPESREHARKMMTEYGAAFSGGEGGAKEEPNHEDEIRDMETRLSEVREKLRSYDGGDRPSSPPVSLLREERDLIARIEAMEDARDARKPTILPAGKPPPFLRVGMVLENPEGGRWKVVGVGESHPAKMGRTAVINERAGLGWANIAEVVTWPLADDFEMEGETAPAERRKPCTCNSSTSPRRCDGQARLGGGWYCVEGKP